MIIASDFCTREIRRSGFVSWNMTITSVSILRRLYGYPFPYWSPEVVTLDSLIVPHINRSKKGGCFDGSKRLNLGQALTAFKVCTRQLQFVSKVWLRCVAEVIFSWQSAIDSPASRAALGEANASAGTGWHTLGTRKRKPPQLVVTNRDTASGPVFAQIRRRSRVL